MSKWIQLNGTGTVVTGGGGGSGFWIQSGSYLYPTSTSYIVLAGVTSTDLTLSAGAIVSSNTIVSITASTNASVMGFEAVPSGRAVLYSNKTGTGAVLAMAFDVAGAERARFLTTGQFLLARTTDDGSGLALQVNGALSLTGNNVSAFNARIWLDTNTAAGQGAGSAGVAGPGTDNTAIDYFGMEGNFIRIKGGTAATSNADYFDWTRWGVSTSALAAHIVQFRDSSNNVLINYDGASGALGGTYGQVTGTFTFSGLVSAYQGGSTAGAFYPNGNNTTHPASPASGYGGFGYKSGSIYWYWNGASWATVDLSTSGGAGFWTESTGLLYPSTITDKVLINRTTDDGTTFPLQVSGSASISVGVQSPLYRVSNGSDYFDLLNTGLGTHAWDLRDSGSNPILTYRNATAHWYTGTYLMNGTVVVQSNTHGTTPSATVQQFYVAAPTAASPQASIGLLAYDSNDTQITAGWHWNGTQAIADDIAAGQIVFTGGGTFFGAATSLTRGSPVTFTTTFTASATGDITVPGSVTMGGNLSFRYSGGHVQFSDNNGAAWNNLSSGGGGVTIPLSQNLTWTSNNVYDVGDFGGTGRPRTIYVGTGVESPLFRVRTAADYFDLIVAGAHIYEMKDSGSNIIHSYHNLTANWFQGTWTWIGLQMYLADNTTTYVALSYVNGAGSLTLTNAAVNQVIILEANNGAGNAVMLMSGGNPFISINGNNGITGETVTTNVGVRNIRGGIITV